MQDPQKQDPPWLVKIPREQDPDPQGDEGGLAIRLDPDLVARDRRALSAEAFGFWPVTADLSKRAARGLADASVRSVDTIGYGWSLLWQHAVNLSNKWDLGQIGREEPEKRWLPRAFRPVSEAVGKPDADSLDVLEGLGLVDDADKIRRGQSERLAEWEMPAAIAGELASFATPGGPVNLVGKGGQRVAQLATSQIVDAIALAGPANRYLRKLVDAGQMSVESAVEAIRSGNVLSAIAKAEGRSVSMAAKAADATPATLGEYGSLLAQTYASAPADQAEDALEHMALLGPAFMGISRLGRWASGKLVDAAVTPEGKDALLRLWDASQNGKQPGLWRSLGSLSARDQSVVAAAELFTATVESFAFTATNEDAMDALFDAAAGKPGSWSRFGQAFAGTFAGILYAKGMPWADLPYFKRVRPDLNSLRTERERQERQKAEREQAAQAAEQARMQEAQGREQKFQAGQEAAAEVGAAIRQTGKDVAREFHVERKVQEDAVVNSMVDPLLRSGLTIEHARIDQPIPEVKLNTVDGMGITVRVEAPGQVILDVPQRMWARVRGGERPEGPLQGTEAATFLNDLSMHAVAQQLRGSLRFGRLNMLESTAGGGWREPTSGFDYRYGIDGNIYRRSPMERRWEPAPAEDPIHWMTADPVGSNVTDKSWWHPNLDEWARFVQQKSRAYPEEAVDELLAMALNTAQYGGNSRSAEELRAFLTAVTPAQVLGAWSPQSSKAMAHSIAAVGAGLSNHVEAQRLVLQVIPELAAGRRALWEAAMAERAAQEGPRMLQDAAHEAKIAERAARRQGKEQAADEPQPAAQESQPVKEQTQPQYKADTARRERMTFEVAELPRDQTATVTLTDNQRARILEALRVDPESSDRLAWWENALSKPSITFRPNRIKELMSAQQRYIDRWRAGANEPQAHARVQTIDSAVEKMVSAHRRPPEVELGQMFGGVPLGEALKDLRGLVDPEAALGDLVATGKPKDKTISIGRIMRDLIDEPAFAVGRIAGARGERAKQEILEALDAHRGMEAEILPLREKLAKTPAATRKWLMETVPGEGGKDRLSRAEVLASGGKLEDVPPRAQEVADLLHEIRVLTGRFAERSKAMRVHAPERGEDGKIKTGPDGKPLKPQWEPFQVREDARIDPRTDATAEWYKVLSTPEAPRSREILTELAKRNGMKDPDAFYERLTGQRPEAARGTSLDKKSSTEFFRQMKYFPSQLELPDGTMVRLRSGDPWVMGESMIRSEIRGATGRTAFGQQGVPEPVRKKYGLKPGPEEFVKEMRKAASEEPGATPEYIRHAEKVATDAIRRVEGMTEVQDIPKALRGIEKWRRTGMLSASFAQDLAEVIGSAPHMAGFRNVVLAGLKSAWPGTLLRNYRMAKETGAIVKEWMTYDQGAIGRGVLEKARGLVGAPKFISMRISDTLAAVSAREMVADLRAGKATGTHLEGLRELGFTDPQIATMRAGGAEAEPLYSSVMRRFVHTAQSSKTPGEMSPLANSKWFRRIFPFANWAINRANRQIRLFETVGDAFRSGDKGRQVAAMSRVLKFYVGSTIAGSLGNLFAHMLREWSLKEGWEQTLREAEYVGWTRFLAVNGLVQSLVGGPLASAFHLFTDDSQPAAQKVANLTAPGQWITSLVQMANGEGPFRDQPAWQRPLTFVGRNYALGKHLDGPIAMFGLSEADNGLDEAKAAGYRWMRDEGKTFPVTMPSQDGQEFRVAMRSLFDEVARGVRVTDSDQGFAQMLDGVISRPKFQSSLREALGLDTGDSIARSLRARRFLPSDPTERDRMLQFVGREKMRTLYAHDRALEALATMAKDEPGTEPAQTDQATLEQQLEVAERQLSLGGDGRMWRQAFDEVQGRAVEAMKAGAPLPWDDLDLLARRVAAHPETWGEVLTERQALTIEGLPAADAELMLLHYWRQRFERSATRELREDLKK